MTGIVFRGRLEGGSALLAGGCYRGKVQHSISIYHDSGRDITVAAGKIWGDDMVLKHAAVGQCVTLRLDDGRDVRALVHRRSTDNRYISIGVDGSVPGF